MEKWKIYSHPKNISSNQLFSNFISKTVVLTKFLLKNSESKIPFFPQCTLWKFTKFVSTIFILHDFSNFPWNQHSNGLCSKIGFTNPQFSSFWRKNAQESLIISKSWGSKVLELIETSDNNGKWSKLLAFEICKVQPSYMKCLLYQ